MSSDDAPGAKLAKLKGAFLDLDRQLKGKGKKSSDDDKRAAQSYDIMALAVAAVASKGHGKAKKSSSNLAKALEKTGLTANTASEDAKNLLDELVQNYTRRNIAYVDSRSRISQTAKTAASGIKKNMDMGGSMTPGEFKKCLSNLAIIAIEELAHHHGFADSERLSKSNLASNISQRAAMRNWMVDYLKKEIGVNLTAASLAADQAMEKLESEEVFVSKLNKQIKSAKMPNLTAEQQAIQRASQLSTILEDYASGLVLGQTYHFNVEEGDQVRMYITWEREDREAVGDKASTGLSISRAGQNEYVVELSGDLGSNLRMARGKGQTRYSFDDPQKAADFLAFAMCGAAFPDLAQTCGAKAIDVKGQDGAGVEVKADKSTDTGDLNRAFAPGLANILGTEESDVSAHAGKPSRNLSKNGYTAMIEGTAGFKLKVGSDQGSKSFMQKLDYALSYKAGESGAGQMLPKIFDDSANYEFKTNWKAAVEEGFNGKIKRVTIDMHKIIIKRRI